MVTVWWSSLQVLVAHLFGILKGWMILGTKIYLAAAKLLLLALLTWLVSFNR